MNEAVDIVRLIIDDTAKCGLKVSAQEAAAVDQLMGLAAHHLAGLSFAYHRLSPEIRGYIDYILGALLADPEELVADGSAHAALNAQYLEVGRRFAYVVEPGSRSETPNAITIIAC